jgi:hypothetical protein
VTGLLGGVALGAVAGARRTASAYGRYLESINASDVFVNVPGTLPGLPATKPITLISSLPGGTVSYQFQPVNAQGQPTGKPFTRSYRVAAIVQVPPALADGSDEVEGASFRRGRPGS